MITLDTFRIVANNSKLGKDEALTFSDDNKTVICGLRGQKRSVKTADDIDLKQNAIYMRSSLLTGIRDKLGLSADSPAFKKFEKMIFGELVNGRFDAEVASKPLAKREIKTILDELDAATRDLYKTEKFDPEKGFDYAKHKNQVGIVFSFGKSVGSKAQQFFEKRLDLKKIAKPGAINKIANKHLTNSKTGEDLIYLGVTSTLNSTKVSGGVPDAFKTDLARSAGGFTMPDGSKINPHSKDSKVPKKEIYDRFTEKITKGRVLHFDDLTGKDLKLVQFTMAMMNQRTLVPLAYLEQDMIHDDTVFLMTTKATIGYQVSINDDGSVTFKGSTHSEVKGIASSKGLEVPTDQKKSSLGYSFEITYSAERLNQIFEHDWSDPSPNWIKADKREFYFTCNLEA